MADKINRYAEEHDKTVYEIGHGVSWVFSIVFMLVLAVPPPIEHLIKLKEGKWNETPAGKLLSWRPGQEPLMKRLHSVEKSMDAACYSTALRQHAQQWLAEEMGEGNRKVFIGFNGWLFYQPDLKALTGYGPLKPEPFSVMKDPELAKLRDAKDVIIEFAAQLKERGVPLLIVPVPLKPMIYGEYVSSRATAEWVTHPDATALYQLLRDQGVDVLDLTPDLARFRSRRKHIYIRAPKVTDRAAIAEAAAMEKAKQDSFLMQDTHWTADAMRFAAEKVAAYVKGKYPQIKQPVFKEIRAVDGDYGSSQGDLVKLLDVRAPDSAFSTEEQFLRRISDTTESKLASVALLGDSFVNIYDDPGLGFEKGDKPSARLHAGFAQQLSLLLGQPLDVIARNGQGSTAVRREFAARYDDEVREKKLVVWVIAARDLLLTKSAARDANVEWARVEFNPKPSPGASAASVAEPSSSIVVEALLKEKSRNQELNGTPYTNALHTAIYEVQRVISGSLDAKSILALQWTFREKVMQPTAALQAGQRVRLTLVPWAAREAELKTVNQQDDTTSLEPDRWFVEKAELLP
jgi:SGNH hydrolase-like domain, acetyltransferase AlgX